MNRVVFQPTLEKRADDAARSLQAGRTRHLGHRAECVVKNTNSGAGSPLSAVTRASFEPQFGWNFADVRIHSDERAASLAADHDARAVTAGRDISFGVGQYAPETIIGRELLAHELAHVIQQSTIPGLAGWSQCKEGPTVNKPVDPAADYVHKAEGLAIAKYTVNGIDLRVGVPIPELPNFEKKLASIASEIARGNASIANAALQVKLCVIATGTTHYATYKGSPILTLDPADADADTARHEMGHAVFAFYRSLAGKSKSSLKDASLIIADIYVRLKSTKPVDDDEKRTSGATEKRTHPAGLWIVDPSQWSSMASEHPWDNPDEFFASARKAYLTDKTALKKAIARFTKLDKQVAKPAADLLTTLEALQKAKAPAKLKKVSAEAEQELANLEEPTKTEEVLGASVRKAQRWALDPSTMPGAAP